MHRRQWLHHSACALATAGIGRPAGAATALDTVSVLHWWTSLGEGRAKRVLIDGLRGQGLKWHDFAVPGGAGVAAVKVLRNRLLMGQPPDMAQLIGSTLTAWAEAGLVLPLTDVAQILRWDQQLLPSINRHIMHDGQAMAMPLGIHRINNLFINDAVFAAHGLTPPRQWRDVFVAADVLQRAGITPMAWSDQPWQIATVFETMLLGDAGPADYRALVQQESRALWQSSVVRRSLLRLTKLRELGAKRPDERDWGACTRDLFEGRAAMMIMGDWVRGELQAMGDGHMRGFSCVPTPGTERMHLYSLDSLAMLQTPSLQSDKRLRLAQTLTEPSIQGQYNAAKGSVPVLRHADLQGLSTCAQASWRDFTSPTGQRAPSLAHRMAGSESFKDHVAHVVWRHVTGQARDPLDTQRRLGAAVRATEHPPLKAPTCEAC